jgi:putative transposase
MDFRIRKNLPHTRPAWVSDKDPLFLTLCCQPRWGHHFDNPQAWLVLLTAAQRLKDQALWEPLLMLGMPDHVHVIARVPHRVEIPYLFWRMKRDVSFSLREIGLKTRWQRDGFDHRLRNHHEYLAKRDYILMNPVRAGLSRKKGEWPYFMDWEGQAGAGAMSQCDCDPTYP